MSLADLATSTKRQAKEPMKMSHPRTKRIFPGQQERINNRLTPDINNTPPLLVQDQTMTEDDNRHLTHPYLSPGQE